MVRTTRPVRINHETGALSIICVLLLLVAFTAGFGTWGLLRHWRHLVETQLRLDRCVGTKALELKSMLRALSHSNQRMIQERRAALASAALSPQASAAIRSVLELEYGLQEALRIKWRTEQTLWLARGGCGGMKDQAPPLPALAWIREPPDPLGPRPFTWDPSVVRGGFPDFRIRLRHAPRVAASRVKVKGTTNDETDWKAEWADFY